MPRRRRGILGVTASPALQTAFKTGPGPRPATRLQPSVASSEMRRGSLGAETTTSYG